MAYCPDCGEALHTCEVELPDPAAEAARAETKVAKTYTGAEVEIARLNAERDVAVARIQAGIIKDEVIVEAIVAEAEADATADAIAPEPEEDPVPVVVVDANAEAEAEPTIPPADDQSGEPVTSGSRPSNPWW